MQPFLTGHTCGPAGAQRSHPERLRVEMAWLHGHLAAWKRESLDVAVQAVLDPFSTPGSPAWLRSPRVASQHCVMDGAKVAIDTVASMLDPISPEQCRGARAVLGWTRRRLADEAGVPVRAVTEQEAAGLPPDAAAARAIRAALEVAGIEFIEQGADRLGLRFMRPRRSLSGHPGKDAGPSDLAVAAAWCRGGRRLLGWSQERLAGAALVASTVVRRIEQPGSGPVPPEQVAQVLAALRSAGVVLSAESHSAWVGLPSLHFQPGPSSLAALCEAGAGLLGWSSERLTLEAMRQGVPVRRLKSKSRAKVQAAEAAAMRAAVSSAGVDFSGEGGTGVGVWLTPGDGPPPVGHPAPIRPKRG